MLLQCQFFLRIRGVFPEDKYDSVKQKAKDEEIGEQGCGAKSPAATLED
jgi:hypothetical protein